VASAKNGRATVGLTTGELMMSGLSGFRVAHGPHQVGGRVLSGLNLLAPAVGTLYRVKLQFELSQGLGSDLASLKRDVNEASSK
jgi:hypothetical protein